MKKKPFTTWVKTYGVRKLSEELGLHPSTIRKWRKGHCPRPEHMRRICTISKGAITFDHILSEVRR